eukprot:CAMPEP_0114551978 /NCGR_PEP_ID=MMETSP0114-20121206/6883_1 /TAXON_ID=31324 /ORGANISM="Goniomonas sp, Strain m" /LENGTH=248 /DNA_ID=CAMNT_0001736831 /DNA_START=123 /DNA_END=869 /DNA_ORIENTATION=+
MPVPVRTTLIRLDDDSGYVLFSPLCIDSDIIDTLIGEKNILAIVAPNAYHHLWAHKAMEKYPEAKLISSPALSRRFPNSNWGKPLDVKQNGKPLLAAHDELTAFVVPSTTDEIVLFHAPSRTLICADLAFNFTADQVAQMPWYGRLYLKTTMRRAVCVSEMFRYVFTNADAALAVVEQLLQLPFDTLIVAHGDNVLLDARQALTLGTYNWLVEIARSRKESHAVRNTLLLTALIGAASFAMYKKCNEQ